MTRAWLRENLVPVAVATAVITAAVVAGLSLPSTPPPALPGRAPASTKLDVEVKVLDVRPSPECGGAGVVSLMSYQEEGVEYRLSRCGYYGAVGDSFNYVEDRQ